MLDKLGQTLAACGRRFQAEPPRAQGSDTWVDGSDKDNYKPESVVSDTQRTDSVVDVEEHASTKVLLLISYSSYLVQKLTKSKARH